MRTAIVIGATGLIGHELVNMLSEDLTYKKIIVLTRRSVHWSSAKIENNTIDFEKLEQLQFSPNADYFCALGTTIKQAGSQAKFCKVDYDYVYSFAKVAEKCHADSFHLVSALGASLNSANLYSKTKGRIENSVSNLNIKKIRIYRPSLLIGERSQLGQPTRLGEEIFAILYAKAKFLFSGFLRKYEPITAKRVANAMIKNAIADLSDKKLIISNEEMHLT